MKMAKIYDFQGEKAHRERDQIALLSTYDTLGCPYCMRMANPVDRPTRPFAVTVDNVTSYRCGDGHVWRIDADGQLMRGLRGKRYW